MVKPRQLQILRRALGLLIGLGALSSGLWFLFGRPHAPADAHTTLRVMTYSSFMNAWGPGPEIAKRFREETGVTVEYQDAGDAGLLLEKLKLFPVDVVVGLDGLSLDQAREHLQWRDVTLGERFREPNFTAFDWAPLAFVYRKGEIEPPAHLRDLLEPRFKGAIALEDPRTSTPGLQFFFWVLDTYGENEGFKFLSALKSNIHSVSPSWSTAYGSFTKKQSKLVLSYLTSPVYHLMEERDPSYAAVSFAEGQPIQIEYAGVPEVCSRCEDGERFVRFLLKDEIQGLIMKKNFMMPVVSAVAVGTPFAAVPDVKVIELKSAPDFMKRRSELFEKWRTLGL